MHLDEASSLELCKGREEKVAVSWTGALVCWAGGVTWSHTNLKAWSPLDHPKTGKHFKRLASFLGYGNLPYLFFCSMMSAVLVPRGVWNPGVWKGMKFAGVASEGWSWTSPWAHLTLLLDFIRERQGCSDPE